MRRVSFAAALVAALSSAAALAQVPDPDPGSGSDTTVARQRPAVTSPANEAQSGVSESALSVLGSTDATEAALTIATKPKISDSGIPNATLVFKAPLAKTGGETPFLTEQGLSNKFAVEGALTWLFMDTSGAVLAGASELSEKYQENCRRSTEASEGYRTLQGATPLELRQKQVTLIETVCKPYVDVVTRDPKELALHLSQPEVARIASYLKKRDAQNIYLVNVSASAGYKKFDYLNITDFTKRDTTKHPVAFSFGAGINPGKDQPFFAVGYQYRRDYKEADKRVICPVPGGAAQIECQNAVFDLPKREVDHTAFALVRTTNLFGAIKGKRYSPLLEIKGGYDFKDDVWGVSVPVYLFLDKDKSFKGGFRVSWQERAKDAPADDPEDRFKFNIFIVKSFDFFGFQ